MNNNSLHPHKITLADLRSMTEEELCSLRGLVNLALRKAPTLTAGPGRGHKKLRKMRDSPDCSTPLIGA